VSHKDQLQLLFQGHLSSFFLSPSPRHFRILRNVYSLLIYPESVGSKVFRNVCIYMPNYMASHRTKPYFNTHSHDIIISHNGNHCPVLLVLFLCLGRPLLGLPVASYMRSRYVLCLSWGFCVLTMTMRVAGLQYGSVVMCCVLYQLGVLWSYCSTVLLCVCRSAAFSHWYPLFLLVAGWFRCHFERAMSMGNYELRHAVKKLYQLLPKVTASSVSVASRG